MSVANTLNVGLLGKHEQRSSGLVLLYMIMPLCLAPKACLLCCFLLLLPARAAAKKTLICFTKPVSGQEIKSYMCCYDLVILLDFDCYIRGQRSSQYSIPVFVSYLRTQRRECKLTEVRVRPLPMPVISVMKSELCDFRVTKQPCRTASRSRIWHRLFQKLFMRTTYPWRYVYFWW